MPTQRSRIFHAKIIKKYNLSKILKETIKYIINNDKRRIPQNV